MKFLSVLFFLSTVVLFSNSTHAADFELTPLLGYTFGGSVEDSDTEDSYDFNDSENYGFILGLRDDSKAGDAFYEFLYSHQPTYLKLDDTEFSGNKQLDVDINYFHLGGRFGTDTERVNPFVAAGIGVTYFDLNGGDSETKFSFSIGGGVMVPLSKHISLRFEGRGFGTVFDSNSAVFCEDNECLIKVKGDLLWQFTGFSGVVFSF